MKRFLPIAAAIIISCLGLATIPGEAEEPSSLSDLDRLADQAMQLANSGRYKETEALMVSIGERVNRIILESGSLTPDEQRILYLSYGDAKQALENEALNEEAKRLALTKFRLAVDALLTEYAPMWRELEDPVLDAFRTLKKAVANADGERFEEGKTRLMMFYDTVYPSVVIDLPWEKVSEVVAGIESLERSSFRYWEGERWKELERIEMNLASLFDEAKEDEADPSLWWVIVSTGGIIISTLTYVAWRKYRGERERSKRIDRVPPFE
jgi:Sporulation protein YpjB (SpoYpjB).